MQKLKRTIDNYLKVFSQKQSTFFYGEYNYTNLFNNQKIIEFTLIEKSSQVIQHLLQFGDFSELQQKIISEIEFECESSSSLSASTVRVNNVHKIKLSTGIIKFLSLLNSIVLSYYDKLESTISSKQENENELKEIDFQYGQLLFDAYSHFHDRNNIYRHISIKVPLPEKGFFTLFKNDYPKELDPVFGSTNHQLEFIILHEIAHILNPNFNEFECDTFAFKLARKIWKNTSYHTVVCEFYQFVIYIYYDFLEKYFESQENLMMLWNNKDKDFLKFKINKFNHTRAFDRFKYLLNSIDKISEHCKILLDCTNRLFDYTLDAVLYNDLELVHFYNIANIEKQLRIQKYLHNKFDIDFDKKKAEELKKFINSKITTTDTEFWFKYDKISSPFGLFFFGNASTNIETIKNNQHKMNQSFLLFSKQIFDKFGVPDITNATKEFKKDYIIMKAK